MRIAICDDDETTVNYLSSMVNKWAARQSQTVSLSCFSGAAPFWFEWLDTANTDILLLDIQMDGQNGLELAKSIRNHQAGDRVQIIFITGFKEYVFEGYDVSAIHYLLKPVKEEDLLSCLDRAASRLPERAPEILLIRSKDQNIRLPQKDILYIEAMAHTSDIYTKDFKYTERRNISELERELISSLFCRCHRSYIVGLGHVERIDKTDVCLDNGTSVPISRRNYKEMNSAFIQFHRSGW